MSHPSFRFLLALILSVSISEECAAQCLDQRDAPLRTNAGVEFLLCFEDNDADNDSEPDVYQEIYLATTGRAARVTITSKYEPAFKAEFDLGPKESRTYRISEARGYTMLSTLVSQQVFKVEATAPIVCYGLNHKNYSADAYMAMPRQIAGREYRVLAYRNSRRQPVYDRPSQFAVAAFEDNTTVTITPTAPTLSGQNAGVAYDVKLNSGEAIHVQADPKGENYDLTGSIVRSDKPVVLFGGHSRSEIPSNSGTSSDHLVETIPPVNTWGKKFIVTDYPFPGTSQLDVVRVLALDNDTRVSLNGVEWVTLGENEYRDTTYKGNLQIEASGPVLVGTYAHTTGDGVSTQLGDPFFLVAPPLEQTYTDYTFFNSDDPIYLNHFAIIISETSNKGNVRLDDSLIPALAFRDLPPFTDGKAYSIARVGLGKGFHRLTTGNFIENGAVVMAYGMGFIDSYGYTAASLYRPTNAIRAVKSDASSPIHHLKANEVLIQNITDLTAYFDRITLELPAEVESRYNVKLRENVITGIRTLAPGEKLKLGFDATPALSEPISGVLHFDASTSKWEGLYPSRVEFTLFPEERAAVHESLRSDNVQILQTAEGSVSVKLIDIWGNASVKLYDALGRRIKSLADGVTIMGERSFYIQRDELPRGFYVVEVSTGDSPSVRQSFTVTR